MVQIRGGRRGGGIIVLVFERKGRCFEGRSGFIFYFRPPSSVF